MNEREKIIRLWFDMWLKQQDLGIDKIFTEDVVYTESWCPKYENLKTVKHWFNEWNTRGKVIIWDIKQFFHKENQTVVEWYFKNEMNTGSVEEFDGISLIEWTEDNKIKSLKEYGCNLNNYNPYQHSDNPQFRDEKTINGNLKRGNEKVAISNINTIISNDIQKVWNIVLAVDKYNSWRSDLSKTEIINDKQFIEYTKNGYATTFTVTVVEPYKRWEFDMDNSNMKGHWIGIFTDKGNETQIDFTENVIPKKWFMKPFVKTYLKKQQKQFVLDLKKALE